MFGKVIRIKSTAALGKHVAIEGPMNVDTTLGGGIYLNGSALAAAELTYIDGITAIGTAQASKAVVLDTSKGIVGLGVTSVGTSNTSGVTLTSSITNALQVVAEDGGVAVTSGNIKAIKGRLYLKANAGDITADGILGQVKINTSITCSADYTNGIRGYLELVGGNTVNTGGANANTGCGGIGVHGWISVANDLTIAANHYLCGVASRLSVDATKTVTSTGKLVAYGVFADDNLGGATPTQAWDFGIYMPKGVVKCGLRIGDWVGSGASGSSIPFSTAQNFYADGQLDIVGVFGESTSNLTTAYSAKCGRFRHIATGSSITVAQETYGLIGQMCAKGATLTHIHGGLMGTFEGTGAAVVLNSAYTTGGHGCVVARPGGHANITCTTPLYGFLAFNNGAAAVASGTLAAFGTSVASASYQWPVGLYIPSGSCTLPIDVNSSVMGAAGRIAKLYGSCAAGNMGDGYGAVETDVTMTGTLAGTVAASSTWITMAASSVGGSNIVCTRNDGIYVSHTGTPMQNAVAIIGGRFHYVAESGDNPGSLYLFSTNISSNALTAILHVNAAVDIAWTTGAASSGAGKIPLFRDVSAGVTWYCNVYTS